MNDFIVTNSIETIKLELVDLLVKVMSHDMKIILQMNLFSYLRFQKNTKFYL